MATKNNPGRYDCYANAEDDEPMFVLLGRDTAAPDAIRAWASERIIAGKNRPGDAQVVEALDCAAAMAEYRRLRDARKQKGIANTLMYQNAINYPGEVAVYPVYDEQQRATGEFIVSSNESWVEGVYATADAAAKATDIGPSELSELWESVCPRPLTLAELEALEASSDRRGT